MYLISTYRSLQDSRAIQEASTGWSLTPQINTLRLHLPGNPIEGEIRQPYSELWKLRMIWHIQLEWRATPENEPLVVPFWLSLFSTFEGHNSENNGFPEPSILTEHLSCSNSNQRLKSIYLLPEQTEWGLEVQVVLSSILAELKPFR